MQSSDESAQIKKVPVDGQHSSGIKWCLPQSIRIGIGALLQTGIAVGTFWVRTGHNHYLQSGDADLKGQVRLMLCFRHDFEKAGQPKCVEVRGGRGFSSRLGHCLEHKLSNILCRSRRMPLPHRFRTAQACNSMSHRCNLPYILYTFSINTWVSKA